MSSNNLKSLATELEGLLSVPLQKDASAPAIDESYLITAKPDTRTPEAQAVEEDNFAVFELAKSIVDYAVRAAPQHASAENIGEAISNGITEAVNQLGLDNGRVANAVVAFLKDIQETVRNRLSLD